MGYSEYIYFQGKRMVRLTLSAIALVFIVSACGGGGGAPDNGQGTPPNPQQPQLITLNYPADFPYTLQMDGMLQAIVVNGMTKDSAYDFTYTTSSSDIKLLIVNNQNSATSVCSTFILVGSEYQCTGTVLGDSVAINASNFSSSSQVVTLDIATSSTTPHLNYGTRQSPVELDANTDLPYSSTVAANGESYYRINNLTAGSRYQLEVNNQSDSVALNVFRDLFITDAQCDPNYSSTSICNFVSESNSVALHVDGTFAFMGAEFDIVLTHLSDANEFEGTWYQPQVHQIVNNEIPHIGIVDNYNSYYQLSGLQSGRYYTVEFNSKTDGASLLFLDLVSGRSVFKACNPDTRTNLTANTDEACTFKADSTDLYMIAKGNSQSPGVSKFIMTLTAGPLSEGTSSTPVSLAYNVGILKHNGNVDVTSSYYHVSGMTIGNDYLLRLSGNESLPVNIVVYDGDNSFTNPVSCKISNQFGSVTYCITTANANDIYIKVDGPSTPPGIQYTLNVSPVPVLENIPQLAVTNLPYSGQVNEFSSEYTVTGLMSNRLYIAKLTDANGILLLDAWDDASSVISCNFRTRVSGGCLLDSGPNGNINMRVGTGEQGGDNNEPGGTFDLDIAPAPVLTANHQSTDTPLMIPDNSVSGMNSQIVVSSAVTSIANMTVEVFLEHGYTTDVMMQLTAPDGTIIPLVTNIYGSEYINTRFNDYAKQNISNSSGLRYSMSYRPAFPLHILNGTDANGVWTLNVADNANTNRSDALGGILHRWGLSFE